MVTYGYSINIIKDGKMSDNTLISYGMEGYTLQRTIKTILPQPGKRCRVTLAPGFAGNAGYSGISIVKGYYNSNDIPMAVVYPIASDGTVHPKVEVTVSCMECIR